MPGAEPPRTRRARTALKRSPTSWVVWGELAAAYRKVSGQKNRGKANHAELLAACGERPGLFPHATRDTSGATFISASVT